MPAPSYIAPPEYECYGVSDASASQIFAASRRVDAHLGRPEGLLYSADANGLPAYMTGRTPSASYTLTTGLSAGSSKTVALPNAAFNGATVGEVVILDRTNPSACEACVVTAATGNSITLANVQFSHSSGATLEFGLTLAEDRTLYAGAYRLRPRPFARRKSLVRRRPVRRFGGEANALDRRVQPVFQPIDNDLGGR